MLYALAKQFPVIAKDDEEMLQEEIAFRVKK